MFVGKARSLPYSGAPVSVLIMVFKTELTLIFAHIRVYYTKVIPEICNLDESVCVNTPAY